MKRGYLTVQLSINPQTPCEHRWTLIPTEVSQGLSRFRYFSGRDYAFSLENNEGIEPSTFRLNF